LIKHAGNAKRFSQLLTGAQGSQVGLAKSYKVMAGDKVKIEAWAKYLDVSNNTPNLGSFAEALTGAFGLSSVSTGEALKAYQALNNMGSLFETGNAYQNQNTDYPKLYVNIILFDQQFKLVDLAMQQINGGAQPTGTVTNYPHDYLSAEITAQESGYAFVFLSNDNATFVQGYFDDVVMTYTPTNILQYNEYYPFGLQTANSWTRDSTSNVYLYNASSELNKVTQNYEMAFREYDPILGRMTAIDPMAAKYPGLSPYNYSFNDPVYWNDPSGADPDTRNTTLVGFRRRIMDNNGAGSIWGFESSNHIINPGFSPEVWNFIGPIVNTLYDNTNAFSGIGTWGAKTGYRYYIGAGGNKYLLQNSRMRIRHERMWSKVMNRKGTRNVWRRQPSMRIIQETYSLSDIFSFESEEEQQTQGGWRPPAKLDGNNMFGELGTALRYFELYKRGRLHPDERAKSSLAKKGFITPRDLFDMSTATKKAGWYQSSYPTMFFWSNDPSDSYGGSITIMIQFTTTRLGDIHFDDQNRTIWMDEDLGSDCDNCASKRIFYWKFAPTEKSLYDYFKSNIKK
jgi:RHS repeat-associated protein